MAPITVNANGEMLGGPFIMINYMVAEHRALIVQLATYDLHCNYYRKVDINS